MIVMARYSAFFVTLTFLISSAAWSTAPLEPELRTDVKGFFYKLTNRETVPTMDDYFYFFGEGAELELTEIEKLCIQEGLTGGLQEPRCKAAAICLTRNRHIESLVLAKLRKLINQHSIVKIKRIAVPLGKNQEVLRFESIWVIYGSDTYEFVRPQDSNLFPQFGHLALVSINRVPLKHLLSSVKLPDHHLRLLSSCGFPLQ